MFVEVFLGIGGFHGALSAAGGKSEFASEIDELHDRGHKFGELDSEIKEIIVNALFKTIKNPHVGPTGRNFDGISQHLLELIKLHPKTQAEMKAKISLAIN